MKAKFTDNHGTGANIDIERDKALIFTQSVMIMQKGRLVTVCDARYYESYSRNATKIYCNLWVRGQNTSASGAGTAGGWGYHKTSAALGDAIRNAGIELYGSPYAGEKGKRTERARIGGCGTSSMEAALLAIAKALYPNRKLHLGR